MLQLTHRENAYSCILTSVKAKEALVAHHLLEAVEAALVHELSNQGAAAPLVLHASFHQIDGVHCCGAHSYRENTREAYLDTGDLLKGHCLDDIN